MRDQTASRTVNALSSVARIILGYTAACAGAALASPLILAIMGPRDHVFGHKDYLDHFFHIISNWPIAIIALPIAVPFAAIVGFPAGLIAILAGEMYSIKGKSFYILLGGLTPIFLLILGLLRGASPQADWDNVLVISSHGLIGGIVYWLIAGRFAGNWRGHTGSISSEPSP